ncbi:MAG: site-specific integrase [Prevotellaceae bacterium]|jgi:integrase|nr:site-specific integrase [Prevotellaceae bacterium]
MVTLKIVVLYENKRKNGSMPVYAKITQNRDRAYIKTPFSVFGSQLNKRGEIKDSYLLPSINLLYNRIAEILKDLGFSVNQFSMKDLKVYIETKLENKSQNAKLDFFEFAKTFIENMQSDKRQGSSENYAIAVRNLAKFLGRDTLDFNEMTATFCKRYHNWMIKNGLGARGQELYLVSIRKIFNEALSIYNDYEIGEIQIRTNPFKSFEIPKFKFASLAEKKALPVDTLQKIFTASVFTEREELARDVFLLSFCLCGMNAKDLYMCECIEETQLIYFRHKTKNRRSDNAEMRINIPPEVSHLLKKYRTKTKESKHVFTFSKRYADPDNFTTAINKGLKSINRKLKLRIDEISLYYARHSWATIAVNDVYLPEELVDECLVHAPVRKMLRTYVKRDWARVDKTNRKVLDYVFYGKTPPEGSVSI